MMDGQEILVRVLDILDLLFTNKILRKKLLIG